MVEKKKLHRDKDEKMGGGQATGISFQGNHHLAHGNKLPALLKQGEMGEQDGVVEAGALMLTAEKERNTEQ